MPIKLTASVGKKVPDELEYSSKSYHASAEIECSSDLSAEQLNTQLHTLYSRLEQAIDEKINGKVTRIPQQGRQRRQRTPEGPASQKQTASQKQVSYLLDLATARNVLLPQLNAEVQQQFGVESIYQLDRKACSQMIDRMQQQEGGVGNIVITTAPLSLEDNGAVMYMEKEDETRSIKNSSPLELQQP